MRLPITVGLVDDHILLRKGLASLLSDKGFEVAVQAENGQHLISSSSGSPAHRSW